MEIKLESGKRYVKRNGEVTGVIFHSGHQTHPFTDGINIWRKNGRYWLNEWTALSDIISEYKEETPMSIKLEVGKNYKLRNGDKALIVAELSGGLFVAVYSQNEDGKYFRSVELYPDGREDYSDSDSPFDIVSEWKTTRTAKLYPVLYAQGDGMYYVSGSLYETLDSARASTCSGDNIVRLLTEYPSVEVEVEE